ncbi:hypothetical protein WMY93_009047 [Mugilogobius chulae]|uniref:Tectonic domain-containing protein n=1 Tax=Mugilogobius chulae TaxID=88201 RepID=A0AAW0PKY4_9GOBI
MAASIILYFAVIVHVFNSSIFSASENNTTLSLNPAVTPGQNDTFNNTVVYTTTEPTQFESTTRTSSPTSSLSTAPPESNLPDDPLPISGHLLQPDTSVSSVCPCDEHKDICDLNCCCDKECGSELALFTGCSVHAVRGSKRLCNQDVASYSLRTTIDGYSELQSSIQNDKNYDTFCIYFQNRVDGLYHPPPALPTDKNFDSLFKKSPAILSVKKIVRGLQQIHRHLDTRDIFYLPSSGITMDCVDANPIAFLNKQSTHCSRRVDLQMDYYVVGFCDILGYVKSITNIDSTIERGSNQMLSHLLVSVEVVSVVLQSLEGGQIEVQFGDGNLLPVLQSTSLCDNVVFEVVYVVKYNAAGEIVNVAASLVLGSVQDTAMPFKQTFEITFSKEDGPVMAVQFSGNPGYVVGLPLVSGYKTSEYPFFYKAYINPKDTLSLLHSSLEQDCLQGPQLRSQILFGHNSVTGCKLRLADVTNCSLISQVLLDILRGQNYPQFVASFGNSPLEKQLDWVAIKRTFNPQDSQGCGIPLSLHLEIKWTKYGTLVNPQAHIVSVTEIIQTNTSQLALLSGGSSILPVQTSVAFISVSAPAAPGYRAMPTIDAKLPFDFFFPFV